MKGPTFKTKIEWCGIPSGSIVQGVAMSGDGAGADNREIGVALVDYDPNCYHACAGYGPGEGTFEIDGVRGGWWYASMDLEPLNREARDFIAAHIAEGGQ